MADIKDFSENIVSKDTYDNAIKKQDELLAKRLSSLREVYGESMKELDNVMGCVLSGAGPTILIISHGNNIDEIKQRVRDCWDAVNINGEIVTTRVEHEGAKLLDVHSEQTNSPQTV